MKYGGGDIIEFIEYKYENFLKDINNCKIPHSDRFSHFIYSKFYLFEYVQNYDYIVWLDADVLINKSILHILGDFDISFKRSYNVEARTKKYLMNKKEEINNISFYGANEGVIILKNTHNTLKIKQITAKLFDILVDIYKYDEVIDNNTIAASDGIPFAYICNKYKLKIKLLENANTFPQENNLKSSIIHAGTDRKIWNSPVSNAVYQEWWVNHKIWHYNYLKDDDLYSKINVRKSNIPIDNIDNLHHWLYNMNIVSPLLGKLSYVLANKYSEYKFYLKLPMVNNYLDIYNTLFQDQLFYRLAFSHGHSEHETRVQIQAICTNIGLIDNGIKELFEMYVSYNNDYELKNGKENGKDNIYITSSKYKIENENIVKQLILFISKTSNHFFNINLFFKTVNSDEY